MEKQKKEIIKQIIDTNESLANAIRRSVNQIPVLAIKDVEIHKNDSALYDEIIAHRLGLVPLKDIRKLTEPNKCDCKEKGCKKCQLQLTLKVIGPKTVFSGDLRGDVEIIYDNMPIVLLGKDQELELVAFAQLGKGADHTKFSPGLAHYYNISEIKIKEQVNGEELIKKLGESILNNSKNIKVGDVYKCDKDIDYIETLVVDKNSVEISPGKEIVFFIESWGQLNAKEIFSEAVKALDKNLKEISKAIK